MLFKIHHIKGFLSTFIADIAVRNGVLPRKTLMSLVLLMQVKVKSQVFVKMSRVSF